MVANDFSGRRVLVTGASSGIGRATALVYAEAGADVVATARRAEELDRVRDEAEHFGGSIEAVPGDINEAAFVTALAVAAGPVDVLVNCAGMLGHGPFLDTDADDRKLAIGTIGCEFTEYHHLHPGIQAHG